MTGNNFQVEVLKMLGEIRAEATGAKIKAESAANAAERAAATVSLHLGTKISDLDNRLFGDSGSIKQILNDIQQDNAACSASRKELAADLMTFRVACLQGTDGATKAAVAVQVDLDKQVATLEGYRKMDRKWLAGALAVLGVESAGLGIYFRYMAGKLQPAIDLISNHVLGK